MDRRSRITRFITPRQKRIEIGPYFAPLAPKRLGYKCLVVDVFDASTLRQRATDDPYTPNELIANIEEVDLEFQKLAHHGPLCEGQPAPSGGRVGCCPDPDCARPANRVRPIAMLVGVKTLVLQVFD
jgi:hypothetical protein